MQKMEASGNYVATCCYIHIKLIRYVPYVTTYAALFHFWYDVIQCADRVCSLFLIVRNVIPKTERELHKLLHAVVVHITVRTV